MSFIVKSVPCSRVRPELILLPISLLLLSLVAMSSVLKDVYFFELAAHISTSILHTDLSGSVRFGVWGYCWSGLDASFFVLSHDFAGGCSPHRIGYQVDPSVAKALHVDDLANAISGALSLVLGLHVFDCFLVAFAILCILLPNRSLRGIPTSRVAFGFITAAFLTTLIMFIFDYKFGHIVRDHISSGDVLQVSLGCGVWLTLAALLILFVVWLWALEFMCLRQNSKWRYAILSLGGPIA
ncbi:hypothetical protein GSI_13877 [Ganoderma sinense ZZ0214-1]|uniref:Pali-domain-containing protein n=1 Tax=Ganoderma sinense ZZ0214-1 TaxID=1077348 RepID=A0A2G8RRH9_9APHY|nr:hypothetical protein GSI_13877 [Ganoderma sinense ZZ0214-1]